MSLIVEIGRLCIEWVAGRVLILVIWLLVRSAPLLMQQRIGPIAKAGLFMFERLCGVKQGLA